MDRHARPGVWHWRAGGVDRFDESHGLPDPRVLSIATDGDRAYVGTALGVAEFEGGRYIRTLGPGLFASALAVRHDTLLVGTLDGTLAEIPLGARSSRGARPILHDAPAPIQRFVDADGTLYALAEDALYAIDDRTGGLRRVVGADAGRLTDRNVSALALDAAGRLWVGYFDRGLDILGAQGERALHVENDHVFCVNRIVHDAAGGVTAVATANGLVLFDSSGRPKQVLGRAEGLIADHVTDLVLNAGGMTVATPAGLTFIDRRRQPQPLRVSRARQQPRLRARRRGHRGAGGHARRRLDARRRRHPRQLHDRQFGADAQLDHGGGARRRRVVRRNLRRRALPSGREGPLAAFCRPDRTDRDQPERDGRDRRRMSSPARCREGCWCSIASAQRWTTIESGLPSMNVTALAADRRPSVRRHRQRRSCESGHEAACRRLALLAALVAPIPLLGDVGVLIPSGSSAPDPAILSLDQMAVDIRIDNGDARVSVRQIFASHRAGVLEGEYLFSMPSRATVSDFAVWDGVTRIPGVILERRRAEEIYESLKQQQIDPGLLQQGERGTEGAAEATRTSAFSARIVPIPGFGTKRLEMEYHEVVPVENLQSAFALPLRPDAYNAQSASAAHHLVQPGLGPCDPGLPRRQPRATRCRSASRRRTASPARSPAET